MHVQPHEVRQLAGASGNDLVAEFSAIRAAQSARGGAAVMDSRQASSRCSLLPLTHQSVPTSFQVTARSSMHDPESVSPRSEPTTHYISSKGSFSMPFKDGKSPKLQQKPSVDSGRSMPISGETIIEEAPLLNSSDSPVRKRDPRAGNLCSHCHSRVIEPTESPWGSEASPIDEKLQPFNFFIEDPKLEASLATDMISIPTEVIEQPEFKQLNAVTRPKVDKCQLKKPPTDRTHIIRPLDPDEVRVSMNRSSISGGLFSSWAAASDSSSDDEGGREKSRRPPLTAQQRIAHRLRQRGARGLKSRPTYQPPATPPPMLPLPSVPPNQCPPPKMEANNAAKADATNGVNDFAIIEEEEDSATDSAPFGGPEGVTPLEVPDRRPSVKNVRFESDETIIAKSEKPTYNIREESLDRVQATLDDLQDNLARLEVDLARRPSDASSTPKRTLSDASLRLKRRPSDSGKHLRKATDPSQTSSPGSKTFEGRLTATDNAHRRQRTSSGIGPKLPTVTENRNSGVPQVPNQPINAKMLESIYGPQQTDPSKLHAPLPALPPHAKPVDMKADERHYSSGSATIPTSIAVQ